MFVFLLWGAAYPGWLVSPGPCLFGSTQMGARPRCSLHKTVRHQAKAAQTQPDVSDPVPTGGNDRCNNSVRAVMDKRKTLAFESTPEKDLWVPAVQLALHVCHVLHHWAERGQQTREIMVSCSLVKYPPHPLCLGGCFRPGKKDTLGKPGT